MSICQTLWYDMQCWWRRYPVSTYNELSVLVGCGGPEMGPLLVSAGAWCQTLSCRPRRRLRPRNWWCFPWRRPQGRGTWSEPPSSCCTPQTPRPALGEKTISELPAEKSLSETCISSNSRHKQQGVTLWKTHQKTVKLKPKLNQTVWTYLGARPHTEQK